MTAETLPVDRRLLFKAAVPLLFGAARLDLGGRGTGARRMRISLLLPPGDVAHGARMGSEEALRTASLVGLALEFTRDAEGSRLSISPRALEDLSVLCLATDLPTREELPRPQVFHLCSSLSRRLRALKGRRNLQVVDWHPDLFRFGAEQLNERFRRRFSAPMTEGAWRGWMAVKVAAELVFRAHAGPSSPASLLAMSFDGHKGAPLRFSPDDHHLVQPLYLVDSRGKLVEEPA